MNLYQKDVINDLSERTNFAKRDIRILMHAFRDFFLDKMSDVTNDEQVCLYVVPGVKLGCKVVPICFKTKDLITGEIVYRREGIRYFINVGYHFKADIKKMKDKKMAAKEANNERSDEETAQ